MEVLDGKFRNAGWRDGNACTTDWLRPILRGAYTDGEEQTQLACERRGVFARIRKSRVRRRQEMPIVEETKQFPAVERRRNAGLPEIRREAGEIAVFQELGKALTSSLQLDQVLRTIMEKIDEFLRPDNWSLLLLDEAKQELYFELAVGTASTALKDVRVKMGQGIAGWVAAHGETVVVPDTSKDTRFFGKVDEKTKTETRSIVAVPVRFRDTCLGVIELINCIGPDGFDQRDLKLLEALSDFAAIALENARHVKRIHELTITDDCTTLYNARHMSFILETEIYRSQRYNYEFSLIFIDLDHFKQVNDTQGHLVGSRLLGEIGNSLKGHCRLIDFAFRYGGDEFVLLLPQTSKENAMNVAKRLHKLIRETTWLTVDGLDIKLTASMGVASYPVDSRTKEGLLHLADEAMYLVKNTNRDSVAVANVGILPHLPAATAG
jgi:diguanylate cyclase (GGDEF)-like protein